MPPEIYIIDDKKKEKFLRKKTAAFDFNKFTTKEIRELVARMKRIMHEADGIGLSANQIGLDMKVFVAEVPDADGGLKFYAVFNPEIEKISDETITFEEGCLSIPGKFGDVERPERIAVKGWDKNGKVLKIKAWGLLARVFQHEIDHLNGKLFVDRAKNIHIAEKTEFNDDAL
jgi:peptide deformylase